MAPALRIVVFVSCAALLPAQGTPPKPKPADYPAHTELGKLTLAAEYMVHSIPVPGGVLFTNDYLVVEAVFFAPDLARYKLSANHFSLRLNGKKIPILTEPPGFVAASLKYSDWEQRPTLTGEAGNGNGSVIFAPPRTPRFPGDPTARNPPLQRAPEDENPSGIAKEPTMPIEEQLQRASLPEGEHVLPVAGLLFFPYKGKTKGLKSVDLLYDGPAGRASLKLL